MITVGVLLRHGVIFPRSRIRGVNALPTRSNNAKLISVTLWMSVACSEIGFLAALKRPASRSKPAM